MVSETVLSFKENIRRRVTNPFLGTFTIVYIIKNWKLSYGLLNFDDYVNLEYKINYIQEYYSKESVLYNIGESVLCALIVLLGTYLLMGISKLIVDLYNEILIPRITKLTNKSKIVTRESYQKMSDEKDHYILHYEKEREERYKIQKQRDDYENKIKELLDSDKSLEENEKLKENINELNKKNIDLNRKIEELENLKSKDSVLNNLNKEPIPLSKQLYNEIKSKQYIETFDAISSISNMDQEIDTLTQEMHYFINNNMITVSRKSSTNGKRTMKLTNLGSEVYNYRILDKLEEEKRIKTRNIYQEIVNRFPIGRLAAYILNNNNVQKYEVIEELEYFTKGLDSDRKYTDEMSKNDAKVFIEKLKEI